MIVAPIPATDNYPFVAYTYTPPEQMCAFLYSCVTEKVTSDDLPLYAYVREHPKWFMLVHSNILS